MKTKLVILTICCSWLLSHSQSHLWTSRLGGLENEYSYAVAVDASGSVYSVGSFSSLADFDPGNGTQPLTPLGQWDLFLNKLNAGGNFVWNKRIASNKSVWPEAVKIGAQGSIFITGFFEGT